MPRCRGGGHGGGGRNGGSCLYAAGCLATAADGPILGIGVDAMKCLLTMVLAVLLLTTAAGAVDVPEELREALPKAAEDLLENLDFSGEDGFIQGIGRIVEQVQVQLKSILNKSVQGVASVLLVVVLCGAVGGVSTGFGQKEHTYIQMVGALSLSLLTYNLE